MRHIPVRTFIFFCMSTIIAIASLSVGYYLIQHARTTLVSEKQNKLFAFARLLDNGLKGTFDDILVEKGYQNATRDEKITVLNHHLEAFTDTVARAQLGIGVGYYSKELDAIITYGPSELLGHMVKLSIQQDHQGLQVMETGTAMIQTGRLVRGSIMNCMQPLIRNGEVIGYVWANELVDDINNQINRLSSTSYVIIAFGIFFSFLGTAFIAQIVGRRIHEINSAIKIIEDDPSFRIPPMAGDLGEIARSINEFAERLILRRKLEEQMQRTDRLVALGEIAAGVAHEIRNPLTSIKGFVQLIESEMEEGDPQRQYTNIVISETDRLNRIVHELLYYARPSDTLRANININQILTDSLQLVRINAAPREITISTFLADNLPGINGDPEQLKQVFLNLLMNAVQALEGIERKGEVTVSSQVTQEGIQVTVEDNGKGIVTEHLDRIFSPFFTSRSDGTGLGLAVVQKIVALHQGEIRAENISAGGARFILLFPLAGKTDSL